MGYPIIMIITLLIAASVCYPERTLSFCGWLQVCWEKLFNYFEVRGASHVLTSFVTPNLPFILSCLPPQHAVQGCPVGDGHECNSFWCVMGARLGRSHSAC